MSKEKTHTVASAFNYYLTEVKVSPSTKANFGYLRDKLGPAGMLTVSLADLTPAKVLKFLNGLKLKESTVYTNYIQFKTVINRYVNDHALPFNIKLNRILKIPAQKQVIEGEEDYLTLDEVQQLIAVDLADKPDIEYARDLFALICFTGMAIGDLTRFEKTWISPDGKWLRYYRKKNGQKCDVPMFPVTHELIGRHEWPCRVTKRTLQHHCTSISTLVGRKVTPHTGRKTLGSVSLELGFSMETVSFLLGHSSIKITERTYARISRKKIERELREIPKALREIMKID